MALIPWKIRKRGITQILDTKKAKRLINVQPKLKIVEIDNEMKNLEEAEEVKNALTSGELKNESCNEADHSHAAVEAFCGNSETEFLIFHDENSL